MRSIWITPALSGALTGLARKNNVTQAKAWAEFPRPFGPKPPPTHTWVKFSSPFGPGHNGHRGAPRFCPHEWVSRQSSARQPRPSGVFRSEYFARLFDVIGSQDHEAL